MAKKKNMNLGKVFKNIEGAAGALGAMGTAANVVVPVVNNAVDNYMKIKDEQSKKIVMVPSLYEKGFPFGLEEALEMLENRGLDVLPSKISIHHADPKYKDCFDGQVVDSNPKQKTKVAIGSKIALKYVTQEVIDESRRMQAELDRVKLEEKNRRKEQLGSFVNKAKSESKKLWQHGRKNKTPEVIEAPDTARE